MKRQQAGFSLVELVVVIVISVIIAVSIANVVFPQLNLFFYMPEKMHVQEAGTDLLNLILEGDDLAPGLRYAQTLPDGTSAIASANAYGVSYRFLDETQNAHQVDLSYHPVQNKVYRRVDGGPYAVIPYYLENTEILLRTPNGQNFFRYYADSGEFDKDLSTPPNGNFIEVPNLPSVDFKYIQRVDLDFWVYAQYGDDEANIHLRTGIDIKQ